MNIIDLLEHKYFKQAALFMLLLIVYTAIPFVVSSSLRKLKVKHRKTYIGFYNSLFKNIVRIGFFVLVLNFLGLDLNGIFTLIGAAGISISLALKDEIESFASGTAIIFSNRIVVGDRIKVLGFSGVVKEISVMNCTLEGKDEEITIPNNLLTKNVVVKEV